MEALRPFLFMLGVLLMAGALAKQFSLSFDHLMQGAEFYLVAAVWLKVCR